MIQSHWEMHLSIRDPNVIIRRYLLVVKKWLTKVVTRAFFNLGRPGRNTIIADRINHRGSSYFIFIIANSDLIYDWPIFEMSVWCEVNKDHSLLWLHWNKMIEYNHLMISFWNLLYFSLLIHKYFKFKQIYYWCNSKEKKTK